MRELRSPIPRPKRPQRQAFDLQCFAGGSNLGCRTCTYFRSGCCDLHHKQVDQQSEACSHYQGKQQI